MKSPLTLSSPHSQALRSLVLQPVRSLIHRTPAALLTPSAHHPFSTQVVDTAVQDATVTVPNTSLVAGAADGPRPDRLFSKLELELKGNDPAVLKSYAFFASTAAQHLDIEVGKK